MKVLVAQRLLCSELSYLVSKTFSPQYSQSEELYSFEPLIDPSILLISPIQAGTKFFCEFLVSALKKYKP